MNTLLLFRTAVLAASFGTAVSALGQHEGHKTAGPPVEHSSACIEGGRAALGIAALASTRLDAARQTNSPPAMRAAMDDLLAALGEIKERLGSCEKAAVPAPAGPHAGHTMPGAAATQPLPMQAAPGGAADHSKMDHSKMGHDPAAAESVDPVCGMKVTEQRHKAEYKGQTYYFCSETDRQKFVASPQKYLK
jgi:YHS domain-containing protein